MPLGSPEYTKLFAMKNNNVGVNTEPTELKGSERRQHKRRIKK